MVDASRTDLKRWSIYFLLTAVISYGLHTLRNVVPAYALVPWVVCFLGVVLGRGTLKDTDRLGLGLVVALLATMVYATVRSFFTYPTESYGVAIARFWYVIPFLVLVALQLDSDRKLRATLMTAAVLVAIGGITILYQNRFGAIPWLSPPSVRSDAIRYASLAGNLTAYGVVGAFALPVVYFLFRSLVLKSVLLGLIAVTMFMTLQKAAIINIALFVAIMLVFQIPKRLNVAAGSFATAAVLVFLFTIGPLSKRPPPETVLTSQWQTSVVESGSSAVVGSLNTIVHPKTVDDVGFVKGVIDRIWGLPRLQFETYGVSGMMKGVGLVGASGSLGFDKPTCEGNLCTAIYPMAHNIFVEFLAIGGLPYFVVMVSIIVLMVVRSFRRVSRSSLSKSGPNNLPVAIAVIMFMLMINMPFTSGVLIQPYIAIFFVLLMSPTLLRPWLAQHEEKRPIQ
jgi:hypothetical protein